jgi:hypothetical protein
MTADFLATPHPYATSFRVFARLLQCFFLTVLMMVVPDVRAIELRIGNAHPLTITDVDQHQLSTADGHVTVVTVVTRKDEQKAQTVGDRFSSVYLGDPKYRLITVVNFQQKVLTPFRGLALAIIRYRLDAEAKEVQKIYSARHINRNARSDILVAADFDGKTVPQFGIAPSSAEFAVLVFDGRGRLVKRWNDVPTAEALLAAINEAR